MTRYQFIAVYILASKRNGTLYAGVSSDLVPRIQLHREGQIEGFTQKYGCRLLVWYEQHAYMIEAIKREKQIKRWRRAWKLKLIEDLNPTWRDLFLDLV
ncbi:MAG: GIY-YIG nuclease family protein [Caulobacteraceae bacterium]